MAKPDKKSAAKKSNSDKPARTAARKARNVKRQQAKAKAYGALRWGPDRVSHKTAKNRRRRASQLARAKAARCATWKQYQRKRQPSFSSGVEVIGRDAPTPSPAFAKALREASANVATEASA